MFYCYFMDHQQMFMRNWISSDIKNCDHWPLASGETLTKPNKNQIKGVFFLFAIPSLWNTINKFDIILINCILLNLSPNLIKKQQKNLSLALINDNEHIKPHDFRIYIHMYKRCEEEMKEISKECHANDLQSEAKPLPKVSHGMDVLFLLTPM